MRMAGRTYLTVLLYSWSGWSTAHQLSRTMDHCLTTTTIDYSAANTFCKTYYGRSKYFPVDAATESIFDGRRGVYDDEEEDLRPASLASCGFALRPSPTAVTDWNSLEQIRTLYLPQLRQLICDEFAGQPVAQIVFWNPMLRGQGWRGSEGMFDPPHASPRGPIAAMAHLDTDMLVFDGDTDALCQLVERNRVEALLEGQPAPGTPLKGRGRALADVVKGSRFAVVNAWRNVDVDTPVLRAPLAVLDTTYPSDSSSSVVPEASPCMERSRWYIFPRMQADEVLLFKQYDRSSAWPADVWHCALPSVVEAGHSEAEAPPRRSFEVRCFVVFDERVDDAFDRFSGGAKPRCRRRE